mgnify:CR=1 FL=1
MNEDPPRLPASRNGTEAIPRARSWRGLVGWIFGARNGDVSVREAIEELIEESPDAVTAIETEERTLLANILSLRGRTVDDVMVPRADIVAIEQSTPVSEVASIMREAGHSRLPVYREQLDDVIGMIHIKDVFPFLINGTPPPENWTTLMREPLYVPQSRSALDVLADMRTNRMHLAIVVDEFSGTDGIITIEDLVEEIVGEIEDEHDDAPEEWIESLSQGVWEIDARAELDDIAKRIDPALAEVEESVDTMGGLTFILAEQVPQVGAKVQHPKGWTIEVIEGDDTHVKRVRLHAPEDGGDDEE